MSANLSIIYQALDTIKSEQNKESIDYKKEYQKITFLSNNLNTNEKEQLMRSLNSLQYDHTIRSIVYKLSEHLYHMMKERE